MRVTDAIYEADDPVSETEARSLAVNDAIGDRIEQHLDDQQRYLRYSLAAGGVGVLAGIVLLAATTATLPGVGLLLVGAAVGGGGAYYARSRDPDVSVEGIEKGYWTGHLVENDGRVVVYDAVDSYEETEFDLELLRDREEISAAHERLSDINEFPVVMPGSEGVESRVTSTLESVKAEVESAEHRTVTAPVVRGGSSAATGLSTLASRADADPVDVDTTVPFDAAADDVAELTELESLAANDEGEAELEALSETSRALVSDLSGLQETAVDLLNDHIQTAADAFGMVSYHFYCPDCLTDDIESRLELADSADGRWYCDTCRSHYDPEDTVPRHRIKDDIVNPVWDQLWREKDDQRRRIYEDIEDQKADLREREFEQQREEIRSASDRIQDLRSRIRDLKTEAKAAKGTVDEIGDLMVKYDRLNEQRKEEFRADVEESFAEIDEKTDRVLEETRNEEQERIEAAEQEAADRAETIREEERKRQQAMFLAEQRLENQRKAAELQQKKEFHKEDVLLETRGELSFSDTINNAHYWKAQNLGTSTKGGGD
ncbi:hypothetical protein [Halorarius halobius]|uniref:hypothetical protein n=1 Tax=Halorarius halobius TaxID=2962671 RepID=UPI0020CECFF3|nr:hypothetical protein [Halorarius halobius]